MTDLLTVAEWHLRQRGSFDDDRCTPYRCHCGRRMTGACHALSAAECPHDGRAPERVGRYGVVWAEGSDA